MRALEEPTAVLQCLDDTLYFKYTKARFVILKCSNEGPYRGAGIGGVVEEE